MKRIEKWLWRYRWAGRKVTSPIYWTEEDAKSAHPDAVRIEGSMKVFEEPETAEERAEAFRRTDTSAVAPHRKR